MVLKCMCVCFYSISIIYEGSWFKPLLISSESFIKVSLYRKKPEVPKTCFFVYLIIQKNSRRNDQVPTLIGIILMCDVSHIF